MADFVVENVHLGAFAFQPMRQVGDHVQVAEFRDGGKGDQIAQKRNGIRELCAHFGLVEMSENLRDCVGMLAMRQPKSGDVSACKCPAAPLAGVPCGPCQGSGRRENPCQNPRYLLSDVLFGGCWKKMTRS